MKTRKQRRDATRAKLLKAASRAFSEQGFEAVTIRDLAKAIGMSTGAVFANYADKAALYEAAMGFPHPWRPIGQARKDGRLLVLLVEYDPAELNGHPVEDARRARTIGHNSLENTGEDAWQFAGWCWNHDHYTQGKGTPLAFVELDVVAGLPPAVEAAA